MAKRKPSDPDPLQHPIRPPLRILIIFAMGQFGWSLASFAVGNLLVYFYMPPEQGLPTFPSFLFQGAVLGVLTLVGLLSAGGRVLDGLVDPFVANWSDRKQASLGKRRWFMLRGAVPFALFGALVFFPVSASENATNFIWLALVISLYYFFFALYVIPYNALMAELGHTPQERLKISTLVSVAWALGFVAGNSTYALQGVFEALGKTPVEAFQTVIVLLQIVAMVFMLLPALFINEQRYARQSQSDHGIRDAVRTVFRNHNFRWFLLSFLLYWLALTFIQLGIGFYTTLLFGLDKSLAFTFSLVSFASSFLLYWPVNILAKKLGNKTMMLVAYLLFGGIFMVTAFSQQPRNFQRMVALWTRHRRRRPSGHFWDFTQRDRGRRGGSSSAKQRAATDRYVFWPHRVHDEDWYLARKSNFPFITAFRKKHRKPDGCTSYSPGSCSVLPDRMVGVSEVRADG